MTLPPRQVRGVLFADYVRMLRREWPAWREAATDDEKQALETRVDLNAWYPLATFELLGLRILKEVVGRERDSIRLWGRQQLQTILAFLPDLAAANDPRESVMRFSNFFVSLFSFPALKLDGVDDERASVLIDYGMSPAAEEAASWQAMGFFEELIAASGGRNVSVALETAQWQGAPQTRVRLSWQTRRAHSPTPFIAKPRVLLVDDETLVARALLRLLAKAADLTVATSATDAIRLLETREFDTVLSDFHMPERDGLSLLEEVARRWPQVRRVLHTAAPPVRARAALEQKIIHEVLDKPAPRDVLVASLVTRP